MCGKGNRDGNSCSFKGGAIGFFLGFIAGALVSLFLATKTGEELRSDIKRIAFDIREKVEKEAEKIKDITMDKYTEIVDSVIAAYKKVKNLTEKEIDFIKRVILEQKEIIK
ncbi:MAG: YtxH domain-containing protein [Actinobacteria bacterium]|nr:YtxH domain-containing protein [Actinomycetota bacterium]